MLDDVCWQSGQDASTCDVTALASKTDLHSSVIEIVNLDQCLRQTLSNQRRWNEDNSNTMFLFIYLFFCDRPQGKITICRLWFIRASRQVIWNCVRPAQGKKKKSISTEILEGKSMTYIQHMHLNWQNNEQLLVFQLFYLKNRHGMWISYIKEYKHEPRQNRIFLYKEQISKLMISASKLPDCIPLPTSQYS